MLADHLPPSPFVPQGPAQGLGGSAWVWGDLLGSGKISSILEFQVGAEGLPDPVAGCTFL